MPGNTTELSLSTALDTDDNADYLTLSLANSLRTVDALFNNVTGHNHGGAHQGGAIAAAAIPGGSITNAMLGADVARDNLLTNPGLEVWSRGPGPYTTNSVYGPDRWLISGATSTWSISRSASTIGSNGFSAQVAYTHAGAGSLSLQQKVESLSQFQGKTVTVSMQVKSTVAGTVRLWAYDGATITNGPLNVSTGSERITLTYTVPIGAADFQIAVQVSTASCTVEINDAMLVVGSQAANYVPMHPADDLARCLRYYEPLVWPLNAHVYLGQATGTTSVGGPLAFQVRKAITPTVTFSAAGAFALANAAGGLVTCTAITVAGPAALSNVGLTATVASGLVGGNASILVAIGANATIALEANP